jgi:RNA polymerase-binding transcription factor DksA
VLTAERTAVAARISALAGDFDEIVAARADTNADDEHDPEGPTIAFERAQIGAVLDAARTQLDDLDRSLVRLGAGTYAVCEVCGGPITPERLAARPATRTCIRCAAGGPRIRTIS